VNAVARALWNPIVAKEYRARMRTWRSPLAMTVYIVLLGGLGWALFASMTNNGLGFGSIGSGSSYGQVLFTYLIMFQMALLAFIAPALTAGAISGERERQTLDLLFVTRISPFAVIWGKLLASISFVVLLLILSVPIFSLVFLFGGVELDQMMAAFLVIGVTALTLGLMGIALSTIFRRTLTATVAAYGAAFVLLVGSLIYGALFPVQVEPNATVIPGPPTVSLLSPILPLFVIATGSPLGYGVSNPNGGGALLQSGSGACFSQPGGGVVCNSTGPTGVSTFTGPTQTAGSVIPTGLFSGWQYWQATVALQLAICLVALGASAFFLPPVRRLRLRPRAVRAEPVA
jgi:ABC-2 type transport system permease protein